MKNIQNISRLLFGIAMFLIIILGIPNVCIANEKDEIISKRDAYTFVFCYYEDALDYAIANLESQNTDSQEFALDIATRIIDFRSRGDNPSKEIQLFSLFQKSQADYYMKFRIAVAQVRLGSTEGLDILLKEFKSKELPYDSRLYALRFILEEVDLQPFKVLFEQALSDDKKVATLGALGLYRLGDEKAKQWLLDQISQPPHNHPSREILEAIQETKVAEAIPLLKPWLTYENSTMVAITLAILGEQEGKESLLKILSAYREDAAGIIGRVALGVATLKDKSFIPLLREALGVKSRSDKFDVIEALLMLNDSEVIQELLNEMEATDGWDKKAVQLAIKYKITQALPIFMKLFEQTNQKDQFEIQLQKNEPTLIAYYEQMGVSKEDCIKHIYTDKYHECVTLAIGIYQMNKESGKEDIKELLSRDDLQEVELNS